MENKLYCGKYSSAKNRQLLDINFEYIAYFDHVPPGPIVTK